MKIQIVCMSIALTVTALIFSSTASAFTLSALRGPQVGPAPVCQLQFGFSPNRGVMDLVIKLIDSTTRGQAIG
ncbi:hypothetical protein LJR029_006338 [Caballeronia sp. LjRoot29]|uniref:hypothetical protein n=1 Tax=Caballeronia sp. LjRoot29 TaxID=3342315 RepID=UPI003ED0BA25